MSIVPPSSAQVAIDVSSQCAPRRGGVARTCIVCGTAFFTKPSRVAKGEGNFCSRPCVRTFNGRKRTEQKNLFRTEKHCIVCGTSIFIKPSHADVEGVYCSMPCRCVGQSWRQSGTQNNNYKHGLTFDPIEWVRYTRRKWRAANPEKCRLYNYLAKQRRKKCPGKFSARDIQRLRVRQRDLCAYCGKSLTDATLTLDHLVPICRDGTNFIGNLTIACFSCNARKNKKTPMEYRVWLMRKASAAIAINEKGSPYRSERTSAAKKATKT